MPSEIKILRDFKSLLQSDIISYLSRIKIPEDRILVLELHNIIHSLWIYWNDTKDETIPEQIEYYWNKLLEIIRRNTCEEKKHESTR